MRETLLVEARHCCAICRRELPPQFHHIVEWSKVKHYDAGFMLALCGGCHDRCGNGTISVKSQQEYKAQLLAEKTNSKAPNANQAAKEEKDLRTLADFLGGFPVSWADETLAFIQDEDLWWHIRLTAFDGAEWVARSALFHLHDKELLRLLKEYFGLWRNICHLSLSLSVGKGNGEFARISLDAASPDWLVERHSQFRQHAIAARNTLAVTIAYIRERYPSFDIEAADLQARQGYIEMVQRIRLVFRTLPDRGEPVF